MGILTDSLRFDLLGVENAIARLLPYPGLVHISPLANLESIRRGGGLCPSLSADAFVRAGIFSEGSNKAVVQLFDYQNGIDEYDHSNQIRDFFALESFSDGAALFLLDKEIRTNELRQSTSTIRSLRSGGKVSVSNLGGSMRSLFSQHQRTQLLSSSRRMETRLHRRPTS